VAPAAAGVIRRALRVWRQAKAARRGVVLRDNWGSVFTGDIKNNGIVIFGHSAYSHSLRIPWVTEPAVENVGSLLNWRCRIPPDSTAGIPNSDS
jgi:hypothetical protein